VLAGKVVAVVITLRKSCRCSSVSQRVVVTCDAARSQLRVVGLCGSVSSHISSERVRSLLVKCVVSEGGERVVTGLDKRGYPPAVHGP